MTLRSLGWAVMPALVAVVLTGSAQTAFAGATSIHQYRLNEFTGETDDFGTSSLVPIEAADPGGGGPLGGSAVAGPGSTGQVPALAIAAVPGCRPDTSGSITRLCQAYAFGFSQGVTLGRGIGAANEPAGNHLVVIEMLLFDGGGRRKVHDF